MTTKVTVDQVLGWNPCGPYTRTVIEDLIGIDATTEELRNLDIPAADRFWVLVHLLSESDCYLLAADLAEQLIEVLSVHHASARNIVNMLRKYARGRASSEDMKVAWQAAQRARLDTRDVWTRVQYAWSHWALKQARDPYIHAFYIALQTAQNSQDSASFWTSALDSVVSMIEAGE